LTYPDSLTTAVLFLGLASVYVQRMAAPPGDRYRSSSDIARLLNDDPKKGHGIHRDFDTWDTYRHGFLISDGVREDEWLSKSFEQSNVGHDGHMRREGYANCHA
jgi:hypothetical protein